jgi:hypothetical protein
MVLHDPGLIDGKISRTGLLERVLKEQGPAVSMLAQIMRFLEAHGVTARSTNNIATLPGLHGDFEPQQRKLLAKWNDAARRRLKRDKQIKKLWEKASEALERLLEHCTEQSSGSWRFRRGHFARTEPKSQYNEGVVTLLHEAIATIQASLPESTWGRVTGEDCRGML